MRITIKEVEDLAERINMEFLEDGKEQTHVLRVGGRNGYTAIDLVELSTGGQTTIVVGTKAECFNHLRGILKGVSAARHGIEWLY